VSGTITLIVDSHAVGLTVLLVALVNAWILSLAPWKMTSRRPSARWSGLIHRAVWMRGSLRFARCCRSKHLADIRTVLTTMDRLFRKGLLDRTGEGKAFRYRVRCSPEDLERRVAVSGLRQLLHTRTSHYTCRTLSKQSDNLTRSCWMSCKRWSNSSVPS